MKLYIRKMIDTYFYENGIVNTLSVFLKGCDLVFSSLLLNTFKSLHMYYRRKNRQIQELLEQEK